MKKSHLFFLLLTLFSLINLPDSIVDQSRYFLVSSLCPAWSTVYSWKKAKNEPLKTSSKLAQLELENQILKNQIASVQEWLVFDKRVDELLEKWTALTEEKSKEKQLYWRDFFYRRAEELSRILQLQLTAAPAKVIFRQPSSWNSSVWINVGTKDNDRLNLRIIAKNSPVVIGNKLVGVVEKVYENKSRVRLITDSGLVPSVRIVRGKMADEDTFQLLASLEKRIEKRKDLFEDEMEKQRVFDTFHLLQEKLKLSKKNWYLAKGELMGSSHSLWRKKADVLKGIGFNYDYADEESPSRELRTGALLEPNQALDSQPLLKVGDVLVTSGLDGVFPQGLFVATVTQVSELKPEDYAYNLLAEPMLRNISELTEVFVLPPICESEEPF